MERDGKKLQFEEEEIENIMIFVLLNLKKDQYCMAKLVTKVGLYLLRGDPCSELLIIALLVIFDMLDWFEADASCFRLNNFSY